MDADRVRSYLQVACAGLGFDIGEVWWMSNENGTSTVAAIEDNRSATDTAAAASASASANGNESDSSEGERMTYSDNHSTTQQPPYPPSLSSSSPSPSRKKKSKKRFLQLYTSKAYGNQRSKLVQPHVNDDDDRDGGGDQDHKSSSSSFAAATTAAAQPAPSQQQQQQQMIVKRSSSFSIEDEEHVLSPRIVEAVTHSTQVVWANCQKSEGLLGRSDMKLQTAIGMPVGVDESGNVWVVVMFSPKNVESTSDAIEYLQYISRSAASTSIPCLLPVVGGGSSSTESTTVQRGGGGGRGRRRRINNMITNGEENEDDEAEEEEQQQTQTQCHSLVSIKPQFKQPDTTRDLGEGVTAKFVSFNLNDDVEDEMNKSGMVITTNRRRSSLNNAALSEDAPKDDFGIPLLPAPAELNDGSRGGSASQQILDAIDNAITDAFDDVSYGVWSTIMNSAGGGGGEDTIQKSETIAAKMYLIQERLEEFANAFLGMSVFDIADAWTVSSYSDDGIAHSPVMKCLFTAAATESNAEINDFREFSSSISIAPGDGAIGKAYSTGYPVWSSVKVSSCCMIL